MMIVEVSMMIAEVSSLGKVMAEVSTMGDMNEIMADVM